MLIVEGDARQAIPLIDRVLDDALAAGRQGSVIEARLVRALAHDAIGESDAAVADLSDALVAGRPAGYCRLFLDEGRPVMQVLTRVAATGQPDARAHAEHLLALAKADERRRAAPAPRSVTEPIVLGAQPERAFDLRSDLELSGRELEVLRLLATELSGPEIARTLFVTVNTLRTHTKHIFTKLDVNTRRAAVRRAVDLGLL